MTATCPTHDMTLPCQAHAGDHVAGLHRARAHAECPRCATPPAETDAAMRAAADTSLTETEGDTVIETRQQFLENRSHDLRNPLPSPPLPPLTADDFRDACGHPHRGIAIMDTDDDRDGITEQTPGAFPITRTVR